MEFETIVVERPEPRIARIVMNRPEARNAQNLQMTYDLNAAFDQAAPLSASRRKMNEPQSSRVASSRQRVTAMSRQRL